MLHAVHLLLSTVNARASTAAVLSNAAHGAHTPCSQKFSVTQGPCTITTSYSRAGHYLGNGGCVVSEEYWNTSVRG